MAPELPEIIIRDGSRHAMKWIKKGFIYKPDASSDWARHSALQPTPLLTGEGSIRVYLGLRDDEGVSRVGYVDVDANDPIKVLGISDKPCLDIGQPGTFDENGVVPCAVVGRGHEVYLYYAGYQLGENVRFVAFGGLAISKDNGTTFVRYSRVPVVDRTDEELFFRVIHSIVYENNRWKAWYGAGDTFRQGRHKTLPVYNIRYMESEDGITFPASGKVVVDITGDEHRVGRPYVIKTGNTYRMFYGYGSETTPFKLGYAESQDGTTWLRKDHELGLEASETGWDSQMIAYPSVITSHDKTFLFYNGNDYGKTGFGYAELERW